MIPPALRFACAAVGVLLLVASAMLILDGGIRSIDALPAALAVLFFIPAAFGGGSETWRDAVAVEENARRFRFAALLCFSFAVAMYVFVVMVGGTTELARSVSSLGAAFSIMALLLMMLFAFSMSWLRAIARDR